MSDVKKIVVRRDQNLAKDLEADTADLIMETNEEQDSDLMVTNYEDPEPTPAEGEKLSDPSQATTVEDLADDVAIFENGPTAGQIKQWKKQYGEVYITSISFDKHIVWRVLSRIEYKQLVKKMESLMQAGQISTAEANMWNEEAIAELCILYPAYNKAALTSDMAGLPSLISQEVLEASGFVALEVRQL
jgi:hypothetical protein